MDAAEIIIELLHDPKSFKVRQTIKALYLEPVELCDREPLTAPMTLRDVWCNVRYETTIHNRMKRFNWVGIGRGDTGSSKVVDLRDVVLVAPSSIL